MKKAGLIFLVMLVSVMTGMAQPGGRGGSGQGPRFTPEDIAKRQTEEIGKYVSYTEGQEAKVYALNLKNAQKMQEMRSKVNFREMSDSQREEMRKNREAQQAEFNKEMKSLFSSEQYKQYEKYLQEREQRMRERMQQR